MNITLIGMPGSGKSVIGKKLAKRLNYKFLEIEEKTILELGKINDYIISPGGSVVYSRKVMELLKKKSVIIFLNCPFKDVKKYLLNLSTRGIVGLKNKRLKALFEERMPLYKKYADFTIKIIGDWNINAIIKDIIDKIFKK